MSSDREKAQQRDCLAVLAEVEQYILQGKRDPKKVAKHLQLVIGPLGKLEFASDKEIDAVEKELVEKLIRETISGKIKWDSGHGRGEISSRFEGIQYELYGGNRNILRVFNAGNLERTVSVICLKREDQKFFEILAKENGKY